MKADEYKKIEEIIGYAFGNVELLGRAFVHSSYAHEHDTESYDRLEFLGDGVLGLVVAEKLYDEGRDEGVMTQQRARIVGTRPLEAAAEELGLERYIRFGEGEKKQPHKHRKVLADVFEAVIGAIYLDGGYAAAAAFVTDKLGDRIGDIIGSSESGNAKGDLQEYCQANGLGIAEYRLTGRSGADHAPSFTVCVYVDGKMIAEGRGGRKKDAERDAAKSALKILTSKRK